MSDWYADMAKAVRKREIALAGLARWQEKVGVAEEEIKALSAQRSVDPQLPAAASIAAEAAQLSPDLQQTFGGTPSFDGPLFIDSVNA